MSSLPAVLNAIVWTTADNTASQTLPVNLDLSGMQSTTVNEANELISKLTYWVSFLPTGANKTEVQAILTVLNTGFS